jgi:hypothetical protein
MLRWSVLLRPLPFQRHAFRRFFAERSTDYLFGVQPVLAALKAGRRTPKRLFIKPRADVTKADNLFAFT